MSWLQERGGIAGNFGAGGSFPTQHAGDWKPEAEWALVSNEWRGRPQEARPRGRGLRDSWSSRNLLSIPRGNQNSERRLKIALQGTRPRLTKREVKRERGSQLSMEQPRRPGPLSLQRCRRGTREGPRRPAEEQQRVAS